MNGYTYNNAPYYAPIQVEPVDSAGGIVPLLTTRTNGGTWTIAVYPDIDRLEFIFYETSSSKRKVAALDPNRYGNDEMKYI